MVHLPSNFNIPVNSEVVESYTVMLLETLNVGNSTVVDL